MDGTGSEADPLTRHELANLTTNRTVQKANPKDALRKDTQPSNHPCPHGMKHA